jgi:glycolate oxidase iron-sulfur subunit
MRRNIDAWWPAIDAGAAAIISTATGCGSQIADYGKALAADPAYAEKATRVAQLACDLASFLLQEPLNALPIADAVRGRRVAVQVPCSQTHALAQPDTVRTLLAQRGFTLTTTCDDHLCCGSAGSYSVLQPAMADRLRTRKLRALTGDAPALIASANIGCQLHLAQGSPVPVKHWTELVQESLDYRR